MYIHVHTYITCTKIRPIPRRRQETQKRSMWQARINPLNPCAKGHAANVSKFAGKMMEHEDLICCCGSQRSQKIAKDLKRSQKISKVPKANLQHPVICLNGPSCVFSISLGTARSSLDRAARYESPQHWWCHHLRQEAYNLMLQGIMYSLVI